MRNFISLIIILILGFIVINDDYFFEEKITLFPRKSSPQPNYIGLEKVAKTAEYASRKTGVRKEFLLGMIKVESNFGKNVGGGNYRTDMKPNERRLFENICQELDYPPSKMPVSKRVCYNTNAPDGCGGWGGAMGPAQLIPSTWIEYKNRVENITRKRPASPWNLRDSLLAMGIKLAEVSGVTNHQRSAEKKAAAIYLAGRNWKSYTSHGEKILRYADNF